MTRPDSRIGFFADDLTGASDVLAQAHRHGLDAALVLDPASPLPEGDVVGVAGTARSLQGDALDAEIRAGLAPFTGGGFELVLYKVCSTFDSSPSVGSIGRGIELLAEAFPTTGPVPVVPAQPDFGRYTAFSTHFGRSGDAVHRLDRHPVMAHHPSTPMHEADLRLVLRDQLGRASGATGERGGAPDLPAVHLSDPFDDAWRTCRDSGAPAFVVDAVTEADMDRVATALRRDPGALVVGSGGIMAAIARARGSSDVVEPSGQGPYGPVLVVSASASAVTAAQIADAVDHGWAEVPVGEGAVDAVLGALREGRHVVAHTTRGADDERYRAGGLDPAVVGTRLAEVVRAAADRTADVMVCGGDTSSHTLAALGVRELRVTDQFVPVGPICRTDAGSVLADARLVLKGGQVGPVDMFRRFAGEAD